MREIKILTQKDQRDWDEALKRMLSYDFYHTYSYNSNSDDNSILFCFKYNETEILLPLIIRKIDNSDYFDITSSYGYVGPLTSVEDISDSVLSEFRDALLHYFKEKRIVSVFSRMHPTFQNHYLLKDIGEISTLSETVFIDLTQDLDAQRRQYRKDVKYNINKLTRDGFEVFEDKNKDYIKDFIEIYNENMIRVNATDEYFFDEAYYEMIFNSPDINSKLYFVIKEGVRVATSIFVFTNNIIQYHLSATREEYLRDSPVRLLIDHVRILGTEKKHKELHLGGGLGSTEDTLFNFKARFSDCRHQFKVWKYITNEEVYKSLVKEKRLENSHSDFFPLYRLK